MSASPSDAHASGLRVGISIHVGKSAQSIWDNGIFQNCIFLAQLLVRSPRVKEVALVVGGSDARPQDAADFLSDAQVPVIDMATAAQRLDLMIEMSAQLRPAWIAAFRERGGRVVSMRVGNDLAIDIERMTFGRPYGMVVTGAPYDEIWTLPQYGQMGVSYLTTSLRAPVRLLPHLWCARLLERARASAGVAGEFAYQPGRARWRIGIFEPNICMVKTAFTPMLACEVAYRARPRMIEQLRVFNALHIKDKSNFIGFARGLDLVRHGLVSFEGRAPVFQLMPAEVDAVVTHQWENAQNYLYYEALHGGLALVHNSLLLGGCGYRYSGFDCEEGGRELLRAFSEHDAHLSSYRAAAQAFLSTLHPEHEDNVRAYAGAIEALYA